MCNIMKVNKTAIVYHKSDLDGVVSAAIATMYENSKNKDVIYIPYSYEDDVKKVVDQVRDLDVVYVLDVSFGSDSKTIFKEWLDEGKSLMWIDHHKGIIEDSKTWGFVVPGLRRVGVGACALASDLLMGKVPAIVRCLSDYDVWNKDSELGWDTVVAIQYALRSKIRLYVMRDMKDVYVMGEICEKEVYVMRDMKDVYVMGERGYLSRTSRHRNAFFSPTPPSLENRKRVFTSNLKTR